MEKKENKARRKGHSITTIPESKKRKEPKMDSGETYVVPQNERKIFHIEVENKFFSTKTGKKLSQPMVVKLDGIKEYDQFMVNAIKSNKDFNILHDARPYLGYTKEQMVEQDTKIKLKAIGGKPTAKKK